MLEKERKAFEAQKADLIEHHLGKFVVFKDSEFVGSFNTIEEAVGEGARRFGLASFLVRQVMPESESEVNIPALKLGILSANPTRPV